MDKHSFVNKKQLHNLVESAIKSVLKEHYIMDDPYYAELPQGSRYNKSIDDLYVQIKKMREVFDKINDTFSSLRLGNEQDDEWYEARQCVDKLDSDLDLLENAVYGQEYEDEPENVSQWTEFEHGDYE